MKWHGAYPHCSYPQLFSEEAHSVLHSVCYFFHHSFFSFIPLFLFFFLHFKKAKRAGMLENWDVSRDIIFVFSWIFLIFICRSSCSVRSEMGKKIDLRRGDLMPYLGLKFLLFCDVFEVFSITSTRIIAVALTIIRGAGRQSLSDHIVIL
jgi:hypothetical protein